MDSPLKGLFAFSRKEQIGLIFFLTIIIACLLTIRFQKQIFPLPESKTVVLDSTWLAAMDSTLLKDGRGSSSKQSYAKKKQAVADPFLFDPNSISVDELVRLGFSQKQAESIERYRAKGGRFKDETDFKKLYVVNDFMFERLKPYITIDVHTPKNESSDNVYENKEVGLSSKFDMDYLVELNAADSAQLEALPGIGPVFARRILEYREKLGGFNSVEQLKEVYGMDLYPEVLEQVTPHVFISSEIQRPIDINKAQWVDLVRHPYIEKHIANSIIAIREEHGPYRSVSEVRRSHLITEDLYRKIEPYLTVSQ